MDNGRRLQGKGVARVGGEWGESLQGETLMKVDGLKTVKGLTKAVRDTGCCLW